MPPTDGVGRPAVVAVVLTLWRTGNSPLARLTRSDGTHAELIRQKATRMNGLISEVLQAAHPGHRPASGAAETLVAMYAPTIQHYLLEPLANHPGSITTTA